MLRIVFLGPPGAGKGTQAAAVARDLGIPHLSTGDLLRAAVAAGTALGKEADGHMRAGRLVPDDLVLRILQERLGREDARAGFLLDGYPRNEAQARKLGEITPLDAVILFDIPESALVERLTQRRSCPTCGTVYNLRTRPPRVAGRCDNDGATLVERSDDRIEAVQTRLKVYREQTMPLIEYYRSTGRLQSIDASGAPEDVRQRIEAALARVSTARR
jgi:adenylate kinase